MKRLRLIDGYRYFEGKTPSKSFVKKISEFATIQLKQIVLPEYKEKITDILELCFSSGLHTYDKTNPYVIFMRIEAKNTVMGLASFYIKWIPLDKTTVYYPWDDVSAVEINFKMFIEKSEVSKLNYCIPQVYTPLIKSEASGLPYDYQLKTLESEGKLKFALNREIDGSEIAELESILRNFYNHHNATEEDKIAYIDEFKMSKSKKNVSVYVDGASVHPDVMIKCIESFKKCGFIKKIVFE